MRIFNLVQKSISLIIIGLLFVLLYCLFIFLLFLTTKEEEDIKECTLCSDTSCCYKINSKYYCYDCWDAFGLGERYSENCAFMQKVQLAEVKFEEIESF